MQHRLGIAVGGTFGIVTTILRLGRGKAKMLRQICSASLCVPRRAPGEHHGANRERASRLAVAGLAVCLTSGVPPLPTAAQDSTGSADACSLLANADVARITGRCLDGDPEPTALGGSSACTYGGGAAQVMLFSGEGFDAFVRGFGHNDEPVKPR
ncbi:MAG: hypothetical protein ACJ8H8_27340 [Geminicoccaceae bacterium]